MSLQRDVEEERLARVEHLLDEIRHHTARFEPTRVDGYARVNVAIAHLQDAIQDLRHARSLARRQRARHKSIWPIRVK